jgi:hypothetical protein
MHVEDLPQAPILAICQGDRSNKMTVFEKHAVIVVKVSPTERLSLWSSHLTGARMSGNSEPEAACHTPF